MATQEPLILTPLTTRIAIPVVAAEILMCEASAQDPEPIWHDPIWLATIDDTTLGEED